MLIGSPGSGKTMIARRVPSILPPLTVEEALEVSRIHSIAGAAKGGGMFVTRRPFRAPHHTVSSIGLLGGGTRPMPGEVSLAHRGVLFLDEFAEFPRQALEVLRQPLEDGHVSVSRAAAAHDYPSRFMLVAAMNPCPCGYFNDPAHECRCTQSQILKYQRRVSGPLLDRIDIQVGVSSVPLADLHRAPSCEPSAAIRERVVKARRIQAERYRGMAGVRTNADVRGRDLPKVCRMDVAAHAQATNLFTAAIWPIAFLFIALHPCLCRSACRSGRCRCGGRQSRSRRVHGRSGSCSVRLRRSRRPSGSWCAFRLQT